MDFNAAMDKISSLFKFGSMPGLDRIQKLLDRMGNPERKSRYIHIAGTNGKGSICTMLAQILRESGYKTGLFTSPYIIDFCDRISVDGEVISKDELAKIVEEIFPFIDEMNAAGEPITEFECVTAIGFEYFARRGCDIVVLETGLGGRFDSTNVISSPIASVISSISLDHTAVLGDSLAQIAIEKAGIIKRDCAAVFCPQEQEVNEVILGAAKALNNALYTVAPEQIKIISEGIGGSVFEYKGLRCELSLAGEHQVKNACTALEALSPLKSAGFTISDSAVSLGLKKAFIPARLEVLMRDPLFILDGGHNPAGLEALSRAVKSFLGGKKIFCIMSMLRDKAIDEAIAHLSGLFERVYIVEIDNPRKIYAADLKNIADKYFDSVEICPDKSEAVGKAIAYARQCDGAVLVCGSLYLASEIRKMLI